MRLPRMITPALDPCHPGHPGHRVRPGNACRSPSLAPAAGPSRRAPRHAAPRFSRLVAGSPLAHLRPHHRACSPPPDTHARSANPAPPPADRAGLGCWRSSSTWRARGRSSRPRATGLRQSKRRAALVDRAGAVCDQAGRESPPPMRPRHTPPTPCLAATNRGYSRFKHTLCQRRSRHHGRMPSRPPHVRANLRAG